MTEVEQAGFGLLCEFRYQKCYRNRVMTTTAAPLLFK